MTGLWEVTYCIRPVTRVGVALTLMNVRLGVTNGVLVVETPMKPPVDVRVAMVWSLGRCCYDLAWKEGEEGKGQEEGL